MNGARNMTVNDKWNNMTSRLDARPGHPRDGGAGTALESSSEGKTGDK
jgi:hypothetical protein